MGGRADLNPGWKHQGLRPKLASDNVERATQREYAAEANRGVFTHLFAQPANGPGGKPVAQSDGDQGQPHQYRQPANHSIAHGHRAAVIMLFLSLAYGTGTGFLVPFGDSRL